MVFIEAVCPKCCEKIPVDDQREKVYCIYCGETLLVSELTHRCGRFILSEDGEADASEGSEQKQITIVGADNVNAAVTVYCGDRPLMKVGKGEKVALNLPPGKYLLWARVGIEGTRKKEIEVAEGDILRITYGFPRGYEIVKQ